MGGFHVARAVGLCVVALAASACGSITGTSASNGGAIPIAQSAVYNYTLTEGCRGAPNFRLQSDSGRTDYLSGGTGKVYLGAGNWTGSPGQYVPGYYVRPGAPLTPPTFAPIACGWSLTLTATG